MHTDYQYKTENQVWAPFTPSDQETVQSYPTAPGTSMWLVLDCRFSSK